MNIVKHLRIANRVVYNFFRFFYLSLFCFHVSTGSLDSQAIYRLRSNCLGSLKFGSLMKLARLKELPSCEDHEQLIVAVLDLAFEGSSIE